MQIHKYVLRYSSYILFYDNTYYLPIINNDYGETQQMCLPSCCSEGRKGGGGVGLGLYKQ